MILKNKSGRTRLARWYMSADEEEKARLEREIYRTIIHRDSRQTNIIEV